MIRPLPHCLPHALHLLATILILLGTGCAAPPYQESSSGGPGTTATANRGSVDSPSDDFAAKWLKRAVAAEQAEDWAQAEVAWEILSLIAPGNEQYSSKFAEARMHARSAAARSLEAARQARKRADAERARSLYLKALAANPDLDEARQALRELAAQGAGTGKGKHQRNASRSTRPGNEKDMAGTGE